MCGDYKWVGGVVLVVVGCPSDSYVAKVAVDIVLWKKEIKKRIKGVLCEGIVWRDRETLREAEK